MSLHDPDSPNPDINDQDFRWMVALSHPDYPDRGVGAAAIHEMYTSSYHRWEVFK